MSDKQLSVWYHNEEYCAAQYTDELHPLTDGWCVAEQEIYAE